MRIKRDRGWLSRGFTLIEFVIVVSIIAILLLVFLWMMRNQLARSRDARRKADLERIKIAFEDYYNDNECYPPDTVLLDCGGSTFQPYLSAIPCDPITDDPYLYVPLPGNECKGYRVYAGLEDVNDPIIEELGCDQGDGCGLGPYYNYGVATGVGVYEDTGYVPPTPSPTSSSTPGPTPIIYEYACDTAGVCNQYEKGHPYLVRCPQTFEDIHCSNQCSNPANWCR